MSFEIEIHIHMIKKFHHVEQEVASNEESGNKGVTYFGLH